MAFLSVNLPAPAGNGSGAAVDVSAFGAVKTVTVQPTGAPLGNPFVTIEASNDDVNWAPLETFVIPGNNTFEIACNYMRATVSNFKGGAAPVVEVGGTDDGTVFLSVAVPAGNGTGANVSAATLPLFKSVQIGGPFAGVVIVEISEDGGTSWSQGFTFNQPGIQSGVVAFNRVRVTRQGVPPLNPGSPICNIGATAPTGGSSTALTVENQGTPIGSHFTALDFNGAGVVASDAGGGTALVQINGGSNVFVPGAGAGSAIQNNGSGNAAAGTDALAAGNGSAAAGNNSAAFNESSATGVGSFAANEASAVGDFSFATGGSTANGQFDVALGNGCVATGGGLGAIAGGNGAGANAPSSAAFGNGASANGDSSVALNEGFTRAGAVASLAANVGLVEAGGTWATALGSSAAAGKAAVAIGESARALRESQFSHASGRTAANGDKQTSWLEMSGTTPGLAANEPVELHYGAANDQVFSLEDGKAYQVIVSLVAGGVQAGPTRVSRSIVIKFNARRDGGITTITGTGVGEGYGDASTNDWTLVAGVGVVPDRIAIIFATGATASKCTVVGKVEFTEVAYS